jgi:hypothetical protein
LKSINGHTANLLQVIEDWGRRHFRILSSFS